MKTKVLKRFLGIGIAATMLLTSACGSKTEDTAATEEEQILKVRTETPQSQTISVESRYIGTVEAGSTITILPRVSAEVLSTEFEVGDHVSEGDLLFTLDDTSAQIAQQQAQAALNAANAGLSAAQCAYSGQEAAYAIQQANYNIQTANADVQMLTAADNANKMATTEYQLQVAVDRAEAQLTQAKLAAGTAMENYHTTESLLNRAVDKEAPKDTIDQLEMQLFSARNSSDSSAESVAVAEAAYDLAIRQQQDYLNFTKQLTSASIQSQVLATEEQRVISAEQLAASQATLEASGAQVEASRASVGQASAGLANAQLALTYYSVSSPVTGTIISKNITEHNMAAPTQAAYVIETDEDCKVVFYVAERTMREMTVGNSVTVEQNGENYTGSIVSVSSVIDQAQGLYKVEALIQGDAPLAGGSSVSLRTVSRQSVNALTVPSDCIYYEGEQPYLYVLEGDSARIRYVTTGLEEDGRVEITEGVVAEDPIIVTWSSGLKDGTAVEAEK
ncbi:MAG: efflux RND transporter periplasmic adaptor subunit [Lachnospiraceae bacterium]|nr:efflux RND transporter periplasmic adaptor subunit [Lachnospiraceae bacterium]